MSFFEIIKYFTSIVGCISGIVTIVQYFKVKPMTVIQAAKSQSGNIFIWSTIITFLLFVVPWNKIHFGDVQPKIVYIDSSKIKSKELNTNKYYKNTPNPPVLIQKPITKHIKHHEKKDTIIPQVSQTNINGTNISGNNNTSAKNVFSGGNGQFNAPVNVGDTYSEHHFEKPDQEALLRAIPEIKKQYGISNDTIEVSHTPDTNGAVYEYELISFLRGNGIPVHLINGFTINKNGILNVQVYPEKGQIHIVIGTIVTK